MYTNSTSIIGVPEHVWDVRDNTVTFFMAHTVNIAKLTMCLRSTIGYLRSTVEYLRSTVAYF